VRVTGGVVLASCSRAAVICRRAMRRHSFHLCRIVPRSAGRARLSLWRSGCDETE
jgi:hypothetical protein